MTQTITSDAPPETVRSLVVDGNSSGDTVAVTNQLWPWARAIQQPGRGKGDALRARFQAATRASLAIAAIQRE
jgi:hypothetical protein